ncbi:MAG: hypothetical protein VB130_07695, partial [Clostridium sp.]|nr:hypothetical protein [Clostridium sp.]
MDILLSLYPENVEKIERGIKRYEFRRTIYKNKSVEKAYVYATAPVKKVVGYFTIEKVVSGSPEEVWEKCGTFSGTTKESLMKYFQGKNTVYALKIKDYNSFEYAIEPKKYIKNFYPPQ